MNLKKSEVNELISKMMSGDQNSFNIFQKEFGAIVVLHAKKWFKKIAITTRNLYDIEDIIQEIWEHIFYKLSTYNSERSSIVTWLYITCDYKPYYIARYYSTSKRSPNNDDGEYITSLNDVSVNNDGDQIEFIDFIVDPSESLESKVLTDIQLFEYIYILKDFILKLSYNQRLVYMHNLMGISQVKSANIIGLTQAQISRCLTSIYSKILRFKDSNIKINYEEAYKFAVTLLGDKTDDELSEEFDYDISVIKICREILSLAEIYCTV